MILLHALRFDSVTRRVGDRKLDLGGGSGGPGDVYRGRRGRLEVTLRSYSPLGEYGREGVNGENKQAARNT